MPPSTHDPLTELNKPTRPTAEDVGGSYSGSSKVGELSSIAWPKPAAVDSGPESTTSRDRIVTQFACATTPVRGGVARHWLTRPPGGSGSPPCDGAVGSTVHFPVISTSSSFPALRPRKDHDYRLARGPTISGSLRAEHEDRNPAAQVATDPVSRAFRPNFDPRVASRVRIGRSREEVTRARRTFCWFPSESWRPDAPAAVACDTIVADSVLAR